MAFPSRIIRAGSLTQFSQSIRKQIKLTGVLQGIGFRPTVYRFALDMRLTGWVVNTNDGVIIEIQGASADCAEFISRLPSVIPSPGKIDSKILNDAPLQNETEFHIQTSRETEATVTPIPPDTAICPECVAELFDRSNRRYLYPFITCTLCGPRFTVVRSFPYDRERTSMADFTMCPECFREYMTAADRRFHSQTNSCEHCGPKLRLISADGVVYEGDPVLEAIRLLNQGAVLAVKGIGGFHLACDAVNEAAVNALRERKNRAEKPFAIMAPDIKTAEELCVIGEIERNLLKSPASPIVLLDINRHMLAENVAPGMNTLGLILPYTPLHLLLFRHPEVHPSERPMALVMTSGNKSEEPIVRNTPEALERLGDIADAILTHDREIVLRADDSIYRVIAGEPTIFRRSRGLVPGGIHLSSCSDVAVLATGGDIKNCLAIIKDDQAILSPHIGDLATPAAQAYFKQSIEALSNYLMIQPEVVAVDPHPAYFSTQLAEEHGENVVQVYHHHAHAISLLTEHRREMKTPFAVFDGTGFGLDETIWGGEFLFADAGEFERLGYFAPYPLPGGELAIRLPLRILAGLVHTDWKIPDRYYSLFYQSSLHTDLWLEAAKKGLNSPTTSSVGRLFDAAAAAVGFKREVTFEGQAAMWLEGIANREEAGVYQCELIPGRPVVIKSKDLILRLCDDILDGADPSIAAAKFHNTVAFVTVKALEHICLSVSCDTVGLTGGCFQNRLLTERTAEMLKKLGISVLLHRAIPPNDGGIAVGQAVAARARMKTE